MATGRVTTKARSGRDSLNGCGVDGVVWPVFKEGTLGAPCACLDSSIYTLQENN